jgi:hypothetical protein
MSFCATSLVLGGVALGPVSAKRYVEIVGNSWVCCVVLAKVEN